MQSVLQTEKECYICRERFGLETTRMLEDHHVLFGTSNRVLAEKFGLKVWLCKEHHTGNLGVHKNRDIDLWLKEIAQRYFEEHYGSREDFIRVFGRNYL